MNEDASKSESSINDLPNEMLSNILQFIDGSPARRNLMKVSELWKNVVNERLGMRIWIGQGSEFWPHSDSSKRTWSSIRDIITKGITHCYISDLKNELFENVEDCKLIHFARPNLLVRLEFDGYISDSMFHQLLKTLVKLRILVLHVSTLSLFEIKIQRQTLLHTLTELHIASDDFRRIHLNEYDMNRTFNNILSLLNLRYPKLRKFYCHIPFFLDKEFDLFISLTGFISKHAAILKTISLKFIHRWRILESNNFPRSQNELDVLNNSMAAVCNSLEVIVPGKLEKLVLIIDDRRSVCPTSLTIRQAMMSQTHLTKIYFMCWDYIEMPVELFQKNLLSLREIGLTINDLTSPVDGQVFSGLQNLYKLVLEADGDLEFDNIIAAPRLRNSLAFPKSLEYIVFRNIYMEHQDVDLFVKNLPKLSTLMLVNIGRVDMLGMTLPCLLWILKESRTIKKLKVKGINSTCFKASFILENPTECPYCPMREHSSTSTRIDEKVSNDSEETKTHVGSHSLISLEDRTFLERLYDTTNMGTRFIPLVKKRKGIWTRIYD